jgi:hypothetical protein
MRHHLTQHLSSTADLSSMADPSMADRSLAERSTAILIAIGDASLATSRRKIDVCGIVVVGAQ